MQHVISIYKPQGLTPFEAITEFKKLHPQYEDVSLSFAGRLDPMAEGLLLVLVGDTNKQRKSFEKLDKLYEFTVLLGIQTDTYDCLGLIEKVTPQIDTPPEKIKSIFLELAGTSQQPFPPYSSKSVNGKPLFYWAREGKLSEIEIPMKEITVYSLELLSISSVKGDKLAKQVIHTLQLITGDFRQEQVKQSWKEILEEYESSSFTLLSCRGKVSSGTYIRGLAHALGEKLGCGALAYHIKRTQIGTYALDDAIKLQRPSNQT